MAKPLSELMAGVSKKNMASMIAPPKAAKAKKEPEHISDISSVIAKYSPKTGKVAAFNQAEEIRLLAGEIRELGDAAAAVTKEKDAKTSRLKEILSNIGFEEGKFIAADVRVAFSSHNRETINSDKLLAKGILPDVIAACTDVKEVWTLRVTRINGEDED